MDVLLRNDMFMPIIHMDSCPFINTPLISQSTSIVRNAYYLSSLVLSWQGKLIIISLSALLLPASHP